MRFAMIKFAREYYDIDIDDSDSDILFILLVQVAKEYLLDLKNQASDEPAPFLGNTTPLACLLHGLQENLEIMEKQ